MSKVITLHGIRTRGNWQKMLVSPLFEGGFHPIPLDYGYFLALQLLIPWSRRRKVEWFRNQYHHLVRAGERPNLVAHSFGTYLAAEAMRKYPEIRFDRIIFFGSIVERGFPWQIAFDRGQVSCVLNESGGRDVPASLIGWAVEDADSSGVDGFSESYPHVVESHNPHDAHSDAFYIARVQQRWIPFLSGTQHAKVLQMPAAAPNNRPRSLLVLLLTAATVLAWYGWQDTSNYTSVEQVTEGTTTPEVKPDSQQSSTGTLTAAPMSLPNVGLDWGGESTFEGEKRLISEKLTIENIGDSAFNRLRVKLIVHYEPPMGFSHRPRLSVYQALPQGHVKRPSSRGDDVVATLEGLAGGDHSATTIRSLDLDSYRNTTFIEPLVGRCITQKISLKADFAWVVTCRDILPGENVRLSISYANSAHDVYMSLSIRAELDIDGYTCEGQKHQFGFVENNCSTDDTYELRPIRHRRS